MNFINKDKKIIKKHKLKFIIKLQNNFILNSTFYKKISVSW